MYIREVYCVIVNAVDRNNEIFLNRCFIWIPLRGCTLFYTRIMIFLKKIFIGSIFFFFIFFFLPVQCTPYIGTRGTKNRLTFKQTTFFARRGRPVYWVGRGGGCVYYSYYYSFFFNETFDCYHILKTLLTEWSAFLVFSVDTKYKLLIRGATIK